LQHAFSAFRGNGTRAKLLGIDFEGLARQSAVCLGNASVDGGLVSA
jgi:hypothetical protein